MNFFFFLGLMVQDYFFYRTISFFFFFSLLNLGETKAQIGNEDNMHYNILSRGWFCLIWDRMATFPLMFYWNMSIS